MRVRAATQKTPIPTRDAMPGQDRIFSSFSIQRITALWALSEAGLGGVFHAFKTPFTGMTIGGIAVVLLTLLAFISERKSSVLIKATVIVLIIKAVVSPHSPPQAYMAVVFQGFTAALIFRLIPRLPVAAFFLGVISMLESGVQKIVSLTILYGMSLWESINLFVNYVITKLGADPSVIGFGAAVWLVLIYLSIYALGGMIIGWIAGWVPGEVMGMLDQSGETCRVVAEDPAVRSAGDGIKGTRKRRTRWRILLGLLGILAVFVFLLPGIQGAYKGLYLMLRTAVVIIVWYLFVAPLVIRGIRKILNQKSGKYRDEVQGILAIFPHLKHLASSIYSESAGRPILKRCRFFLMRMIAATLVFDPVTAGTDVQIDENDLSKLGSSR